MEKRSRNKVILCCVGLLVAAAGPLGWSHCQIPCGIYDDDTRFALLGEHIATIEKSMKQIAELSSEAKPDLNQVVRWVNNKDAHADEFSEIVTYYFMAQRLKLPADGDAAGQGLYVKKLRLLHELLVYSMKSKQGVDPANVEKLRTLLEAFREAYSGESVGSEHQH
ncbi:MAG: hypothetical protein JW720_01510 [Sedimentisphaerales bacterium]|nr:hypothetical protein [Sedimentisphaerales bacterium]